MAYVQSRSGIVRSKAFHLGWTPPSMKVYIGGTDRTSLMMYEGWSITERGDGTPSTFSFQIRTIAPVVGQDVAVTYATPNDYVFAGTLLQISAAPTDTTSAHVIWNCTAVGYQWLLDRYDRVTAQYWSLGAGTMVRDILERFTDGGFRVGYCPQALGNLTMTFTFETVWDALQRIAKACGATVRIIRGPASGTRVVDLFVTYPQAALTTVTETAVMAGSLQYRSDLTQVRTRTLYQGHSTTVSTTAAAASATTIEVNDTGIFSTAGGLAISGQNLITYTGLSTASGEGSLTGVTGNLYDISAQDEIAVLVEVEDSAAQTALATVLGGGLSGQATNYLQDGRLSLEELTARGSADLDTFGGALTEVNFAYRTAQRYVKAGRSVVLNIANPFAITGTYTIQSVSLMPLGKYSSTAFNVQQRVELGSFTRTLNDLLKQLRG